MIHIIFVLRKFLEHKRRQKQRTMEGRTNPNMQLIGEMSRSGWRRWLCVVAMCTPPPFANSHPLQSPPPPQETVSSMFF